MCRLTRLDETLSGNTRFFSQSATRIATLCALGVFAYGGTATAVPLTTAQYDGLNLGVNTGYALVDLGTSTFGWNTGPIAGSVLVGKGVTVQESGGNNGGLTNGGVLATDGTATISGSLQNPVTPTTVSTSVTASAAASAASVSAYASSLAATAGTTVTTTGSSITIAGIGYKNAINNPGSADAGTVNVINLASSQNQTFTFEGTPDDYFIINVTGGIQTNVGSTAIQVNTSGTVTSSETNNSAASPLASRILYNLTGTGTVLQTSGGDYSIGTFLATNGGAIQLSELNLNGSIITTATSGSNGGLQFVSGSKIPTATSFAVTAPVTQSVPEPGSLVLIVGGALSLIALRGMQGRRASAKGHA